MTARKSALDAASATPVAAREVGLATHAVLGPQVPIWLRGGDIVLCPAGDGFVVRIVEDDRPGGGVGLYDKVFTGDDCGSLDDAYAQAAEKALRYIAEELDVARQKRQGGIEITLHKQGRAADEQTA